MAFLSLDFKALDLQWQGFPVAFSSSGALQPLAIVYCYMQWKNKKRSAHCTSLSVIYCLKQYLDLWAYYALFILFHATCFQASIQQNTHRLMILKLHEPPCQHTLNRTSKVWHACFTHPPRYLKCKRENILLHCVYQVYASNYWHMLQLPNINANNVRNMQLLLFGCTIYLDVQYIELSVAFFFLLCDVTAHQWDTSGGDETDLYCTLPWSKMRTSIICFSPNITNRFL